MLTIYMPNYTYLFHVVLKTYESEIIRPTGKVIIVMQLYFLNTARRNLYTSIVGIFMW